MSPGRESDETDTENTSNEKEKAKDSVTATNAKPPAKRRTKTGCLTCRKRRIKCGEEKPPQFCKNCIKSKRECAGYVQPLVYKNQGAQSASHDSATKGTIQEQDHFQFNTALNQPYVPPHHPPYNPFVGLQQHPEIHYKSYGTQHWTQHYQYPIPDPSNQNIHTSPVEDSHFHRRHGEHAPSGPGPRQLPQYFDAYGPNHNPGWANRSYSFDAPNHHPPFAYPEPEPTSALTSPYEPYPYAGSHSSNAPSLHEPPFKRYSIHGFVEASKYGTNIPSLPQPHIRPEWAAHPQDDDEDLRDAEMEDDEGSDAWNETKRQEPSKRTRGGGSHASGNTSSGTKSAEVGMLRSQPMLSPLQDEHNQQVFSHFINVTGNCMTIFERSSSVPWTLPSRLLWNSFLPTMAVSNTALAHAILALGGLHIAKLQQSSEDYSLKHFTYALRRVGKLLGQADRRHDVATLATVLLLGFYEVMAADHSRWTLHLAGAMKLVAEHDFMSSIYRIRKMQSRTKQNVSRLTQTSTPDEASYFNIVGSTLLDDKDWDVDQDLISRLVGFDVSHGMVPPPILVDQSSMVDMTEQEIVSFKAMMDLRWWYCKQDIFQSMVSGDPLLMPYDQWPNCPPRGPIGVGSMAYASFDHLLLILARLSDFGGKDRLRKQRAIAAQGGQWRPHGDLFRASQPQSTAEATSLGAKQPANQPPQSQPQSSIDPTKLKASTAPTANEGRPRQNKAPAQGPGFHGMMPPPETPVWMLPSFHRMSAQLNSRSSPEQVKRKPSLPGDLDAETAKALEEHSSLCKAFGLFAKSLGPDFDPLPADGATPSSPFGPGLRYQSSAIACIWLHYNIGRILLHRLHPYMPPAAMVAAGVAAHLTRDYAANVGKICSGLYSTIPSNAAEPLDPTYAGALIESTFTLLFAGVQYQDISQRGWTIAKLYDIARMTGWQTSASIAAACETAWERMGQAGKGPPYTRSLDQSNEDARVNGIYRRIYPTGVDGPSNTLDATAEHESQFVSHDRSMIGKHGSTRVHWAMGLLSVEEDIKKLSIDQK